MTADNGIAGRVDRLEQAIFTLGREIWVMRDRQKVLETLLTANGTIAPAAVDDWQPDAADGDHIRRECAEFVRRLIGTGSASA